MPPGRPRRRRAGDLVAADRVALVHGRAVRPRFGQTETATVLRVVEDELLVERLEPAHAAAAPTRRSRARARHGVEQGVDLGLRGCGSRRSRAPTPSFRIGGAAAARSGVRRARRRRASRGTDPRRARARPAPRRPAGRRALRASVSPRRRMPSIERSPSRRRFSSAASCAWRRRGAARRASAGGGEATACDTGCVPARSAAAGQVLGPVEGDGGDHRPARVNGGSASSTSSRPQSAPMP